MSFAINASAINTSPALSASTTGDYLFGTFNLNDMANIVLKRADNDDMGKIDISSYELAYNDGGNVTSRYMRGRDIHLVGTVKADTAALFQTYIDNLKKALYERDQYLTIRGRRIKANLSKLAYDRDHFNIAWSPIDIVFEAVDPFWTDGAQSYGYTGKTGTFSEDITYLGSAPSCPLWYFVFGVGSAVTQVQITYDGLNITVPGSFASGDVLIIDGVNKVVQENGVDIDFTGVFPEFSGVSNPFTITFSGPTLVDVTLIPDTNYL